MPLGAVIFVSHSFLLVMEFSFFGYARLSRAEASQHHRRAPRAFAAATSRAPLGIGRFAPNIAPSGRGKLTRLGAFAPLFQLTALSSEGAGEGAPETSHEHVCGRLHIPSSCF